MGKYIDSGKKILTTKPPKGGEGKGIRSPKCPKNSGLGIVLISWEPKGTPPMPPPPRNKALIRPN